MKFDGSKLELARREKELSQSAVAKKVGVARQTIMYWEKGVYEPDSAARKKISAVFEKPADYFCKGQEDPGDAVLRTMYKNELDLKNVRALTPDNTVTLPLLASIPAGLPDYSDKDVESFTQVPRYLFPGADFIIHCCGDSMEPEIGKGAYCVIRKETIPLDKHIMLVKTEDGFTIKRIIKKGGEIELHPSNGDHKIIRPKDLKIIGEVIGTWNRITPK